MPLGYPGSRCNKLIVMVGTARDGAGGIASVISTYAASGLFERWPVVTLASHVVGSKWEKLAAFAGALLRYVGLLLRGRVGMVHLHTSSGPSFWRKACLGGLAFIAGKPVLLHIHSGQFASFYADSCGPLRRRLIRAILTRSAKVIALSPVWRERLLQMAPQASIVCIPNPVMAEGGSVRSLTAPIVLFLGQISEAKGVFDLIRVWGEVCNKVPGARLIIAGDGQMREARARIEAAGLGECIDLPGWVSGQQKRDLLRKAAVCVLPSYFEGMPMSLLEALGAGIPCVATTVGGIPDMMTDGVEGRLVAPGDAPGLAAALTAILSDALRYAEMSQAALARFAKTYSMEVVMPALEREYAQLGMQSLVDVAVTPRVT